MKLVPLFAAVAALACSSPAADQPASLQAVSTKAPTPGPASAPAASIVPTPITRAQAEKISDDFSLYGDRVGTVKAPEIGAAPQPSEGYGISYASVSKDDPRVTLGKATIAGSLNKDILRRILRRAVPSIKFCYEMQLIDNPTLSGEVTVSFAISPKGEVSTTTITQGLLPEMDACIAKKIQQLSFPASQDGKIVVVSHPFSFAPAPK